MTERAVGGGSDSVLLAPWDHPFLYEAFVQIVQDLIASKMSLSDDA